MLKKWKIIFGGLLALVVLAVVLINAAQALEAELLKVQPRDIAKTFKEEGQVIPERERPVYALYGAEILKLHVKEGQAVKEGELLAVTGSAELTLQLRQLEAQLQSLRGEEGKTLLEPRQSALNSQALLLQQARRDQEKAELNLARMKEIYATGGASQKEYEEAHHAADAAATNLALQREAMSLLEKTYSLAGATKEYYTGRKEALLAQIGLLQYQLEKCTLTAPIDGTVAHLAIQEGAIPNPGVPIMNIFQKNNPTIEVYVRTADVQNITTGMPVNLLPDRKTRGNVHQGTVQRIAPAAIETLSVLGLTEQRVKVTVKPATAENQFLFPGNKLDVEFTVEKKENKLAVPKTTLFPYEERKAVWIVREGKAAVQPVETGFENDREIVIVEGLKEGDLILINPRLDGIKAGKKIRSKSD